MCTEENIKLARTYMILRITLVRTLVLPFVNFSVLTLDTPTLLVVVRTPYSAVH